ncbi:hypothetical protein Tco_0551988 [Tanacetum coccineum]
MMDNPNITMEEYIKLQAEKAQRRGRTFNWETATYGKIYCDDLDFFTNFEVDFPAIVYNDALTSNKNVLPEPTVSIYDAIKTDFDFSISFSDSDDEDYTFICDKDSFSYKLIPANDLKPEPVNDHVKINTELCLENIDIKPMDSVVCISDDTTHVNLANMTPLPPRAQRHLRLRYQVEGYTKDIVHDFEQRLDMIFGLHIADEMAEDGFEAYWLGSARPICCGGALEVAEGALDVDEGAQAILVPVQAPQPPPSAASTRTMKQRLSRLEEEVHSLYGDIVVRSRIDEEMRRAESARGRRGSGSTRENRPGDEDLSRREMSGEHPESREKGEEERRIYLGFRVRSRERVSHGGKRLQRSEGARFGGGWAYRYTGPFCPLVCRLVISRLKSEDVVAPAYYEGCWVWGCSVRGSLGVFAGFVVTNCSYVKVCSQYSFDIIGVSRLLAVLVSMGLEVSLCRCWCVVSNCFTHLAGWPLHLWATVNTCPEAMDPVIGARGDECWLGGSCWSVVGEGRCGIDLYSDSEFGWRRVLFTRVFVAAVKWLSSVGGQDLRRGLAWASLVQIMLRGVAHNWGLGVTFCDEGEGSREFYRSVAVPAFLIGLGGGGDLDLFWGGRDMVEERWVAISDGGWGGWSGPAIQGLGTVAVVAFEWGSGVLGHISLGLCGNVLSGVPRRRQSGIESWLTAIVELVAIT